MGRWLMRKLALGSMLLVSILLAAACGYVSSGTWEDDPKNWERAWGSSKPAEVSIPHSWYWRSPHWTREEAYFFQFRWHEELFNQLIEKNGMRPLALAAVKPQPDYCFDKPDWFAPPSPAGYEGWQCGSSNNCWLFRDVETKELFLYSCQL